MVPYGSGICIVQKFPAGSAAADELAEFVGLWNNEIIARGGRMTAGPLPDLQESISRRWEKRFPQYTLLWPRAGCWTRAGCGGWRTAKPQQWRFVAKADTNFYLGGITGDMARNRQTYTWVHLRDEC